MDEIEVLRQYAARSDAVEPPPIDVRERVLDTIRRQRPRQDFLTTSRRPMWLAAAASLLVAATLGLYAQQAVAELQDPFASLFTPLIVTLQ